VTRDQGVTLPAWRMNELGQTMRAGMADRVSEILGGARVLRPGAAGHRGAAMTATGHDETRNITARRPRAHGGDPRRCPACKKARAPVVPADGEPARRAGSWSGLCGTDLEIIDGLIRSGLHPVSARAPGHEWTGPRGRRTRRWPGHRVGSRGQSSAAATAPGAARGPDQPLRKPTTRSGSPRDGAAASAIRRPGSPGAPA